MSSKQRLDQLLLQKKLVESRSQADNLIRLGLVKVGTQIITKSGYFVSSDVKIKILTDENYVSRAALKLASVTQVLHLNFKNVVVLDVGSSTGGFSDFALQHGATKVIAVDVGTEQLHPKLRKNNKIELHEQTDIRDINELSSEPDIVLIDVSFISLRLILPHISKLVNEKTQIVAMLKPQFESNSSQKHRGVIKNDKMRREIIKDFELWAIKHFVIVNKADSQVSGSKGNQERFYLLKLTS